MSEPQELTETTAAWLAGVRVGVGNIWEDDYELPDGASAHGPTVRFVLLEDDSERPQRIVAGPGSVVELGSARWEVLEVVEGESGSDGSVTVRRLED